VANVRNVGWAVPTASNLDEAGKNYIIWIDRGFVRRSIFIYGLKNKKVSKVGILTSGDRNYSQGVMD